MLNRGRLAYQGWSESLKKFQRLGAETLFPKHISQERTPRLSKYDFLIKYKYIQIVVFLVHRNLIIQEMRSLQDQKQFSRK